MIMLFVVVFILYLLVYLMSSSYLYKYFSEGTFIEAIWSVIPALFLIALVLPSMQILYLMEDVKSPSYRFKVTGHQWYWSYRVPLLKNLFYSYDNSLFSFCEYDSSIDLESNFPRLLGCRERLCVPLGFVSRLLISSTDVIHSFAVPSLGLKVDAVPGRINQLFLFPLRRGVFFGQCSEICGSNHSFIPIVLKSCSLSQYEEQLIRLISNEVFPLVDLKT